MPVHITTPDPVSDAWPGATFHRNTAALYDVTWQL